MLWLASSTRTPNYVHHTGEDFKCFNLRQAYIRLRRVPAALGHQQIRTNIFTFPLLLISPQRLSWYRNTLHLDR
jgi:hypothetical protein